MARPDRTHPARPPDRRLLEEARQVADAGDRWLVSAAYGVQRAGTWARRELEIIGDSARAAWHTTVDVSRRLSPVATPAARPARGPRRVGSGVEEADPPTQSQRGWSGLDVLSATPAEVALADPAIRPAAGAVRKRAPAVAGGPRLSLLLRLLSELVTEYGSRHYDDMRGDDRFWTLITLLQHFNPRARSRPRPRPPTPGDNP